MTYGIDMENCNIKIIARLHIIISFVVKQKILRYLKKNDGNIEILAKGGGHHGFLFCFLSFVYFFSNKKDFPLKFTNDPPRLKKMAPHQCIGHSRLKHYICMEHININI